MSKGAFQNVAGWWGHQPGRAAVGGACLSGRQVPTAHFQRSDATF